MTMPDLHDDDELLGLLREAMDSAEPVPADARGAAFAAFDVGRADALLAELVADSLHDDLLVTVRSGDGDDRTVTYALGDRRLRLDLSPADRTVVGQLDPPAPAEVTLTATAAPAASAATDDLGRFQLPLRAGSLRLAVTVAGDRWVTPWLTR
jgi:hypothetical protein